MKGRVDYNSSYEWSANKKTFRRKLWKIDRDDIIHAFLFVMVILTHLKLSPKIENHDKNAKLFLTQLLNMRWRFSPEKIYFRWAFDLKKAQARVLKTWRLVEGEGTRNKNESYIWNGKFLTKNKRLKKNKIYLIIFFVTSDNCSFIFIWWFFTVILIYKNFSLLEISRKASFLILINFHFRPLNVGTIFLFSTVYFHSWNQTEIQWSSLVGWLTLSSPHFPYFPSVVHSLTVVWKGWKLSPFSFWLWIRTRRLNYVL